MLKKIFTILSLVALLSVAGFAQSWVNQGEFPMGGEVVKGSTHGIAVDPDGKVWVTNYYADYTPDTTSSATRSIRVYNADGTEAAFSPIFAITVNGVTDTLINTSRGLATDADGNILYTTGGPELFRINYQTGEGMNKSNLENLATAPTAAASDEAGNIYVAPVSPGFPIVMYDANFNYLGNAYETPVGFARTVAVSADGNTIYSPRYTTHSVYVLERPDEFSSYDSTGLILRGFDSESVSWDPKTGALWFSAGSATDMPNRYEGVTTYYAPNTWYAYNPASGNIIDSMKWAMVDSVDDANERPRGIGFSPDGNTAYIGCFGTNSLPATQYLTRDLTAQDVTFKVNMTVAANEGGFDPNSHTVYVAGSFNEWSTTATQMTDADNDNIYEVVVSGQEPGALLSFKFIYNNGSVVWEDDPNREYIVKGGNNTFEAYFNDDLGGGIEITLYFECDMEVERLSGRFDPATDTLSARGSFNGWSSESIMIQDAVNPNVYYYETSSSFNPGEEINYKFVYANGSDVTYEDGDNRVHEVTQDDINAGVIELIRPFNDASLNNVTKYPAELIFSIDMNSATSAISGLSFDPLETVHLFGSISPLQWPESGWPDGDIEKGIALNDNGEDGDLTAADGIWSGTVDFPAYTLLSFQYKYGANYSLASNQGGNDNESSTGVNHSVTLPNNIITGRTNDTWADMSQTTLTDTITTVEQIGTDVPATYALEQNYPNPFNPTTTINFSLPEASNVVVKVYNLLGQEVVTLVNGQLKAGTHKVDFNASNLSSGLYIYSIQAGDFTMSKKMMLLK